MENDLLTSQLGAGCYHESVRLKILQQKMTDFEGLVELLISVESISCVGSSDRLFASENVKGVSISVQTDPSSSLFCKSVVTRKQTVLAAQ